MDIVHPFLTELNPDDADVKVFPPSISVYMSVAAFWTSGVPLGSVLGLIFSGNNVDSKAEPCQTLCDFQRIEIMKPVLFYGG